MQIEKSLRQYDLDQVMRVERGSLLSVPHRRTPRSIVPQLYALQDFLSIQKSRHLWRLEHSYRTLRFHSSFIWSSLGLTPEGSARKSVSRRLNLMVSSIMGK